MRSGTYCSFICSVPCARRITGTLVFIVLISAMALAQLAQSKPLAPANTTTVLHKAARDGDLALIRLRLQAGDSPNVRDAAGRTPLMYAVDAGSTAAVRLLLASGTDPNARDLNGITPLIEAAHRGRSNSAQLLIRAGANVNLSSRGRGTALEAAERAGNNEIAAMLRRAGARSSGRSVGDTVCVRPWTGDGYCGTVNSVNKYSFEIRVTQIVGCGGGCSAKAECSDGRAVGGPHGIKVGDLVPTVSWCLTQTGVQP